MFVSISLSAMLVTDLVALAAKTLSEWDRELITVAYQDFASGEPETRHFVGRVYDGVPSSFRTEIKSLRTTISYWEPPEEPSGSVCRAFEDLFTTGWLVQQVEALTQDDSNKPRSAPLSIPSQPWQPDVKVSKLDPTTFIRNGKVVADKWDEVEQYEKERPRTMVPKPPVYSDNGQFALFPYVVSDIRHANPHVLLFGRVDGRWRILVHEWWHN